MSVYLTQKLTLPLQLVDTTIISIINCLVGLVVKRHSFSPVRKLQTHCTQTRTTAEDGVLRKFRCHESVATNSSRGRVFVFTSHTALSPRNYVLRELNARQLLGGRR